MKRQHVVNLGATHISWKSHTKHIGEPQFAHHWHMRIVYRIVGLTSATI